MIVIPRIQNDTGQVELFFPIEFSKGYPLTAYTFSEGHGAAEYAYYLHNTHVPYTAEEVQRVQ